MWLIEKRKKERDGISHDGRILVKIQRFSLLSASLAVSCRARNYNGIWDVKELRPAKHI